MDGLKAFQDAYLVLGIGGLSFVALITVLMYILYRITPALLALREDTRTLQQETMIYKEAIDNSTQAIQECARSNQNVASALTLLERSMTNVEDGVKNLNHTNDTVVQKVLVMDEKLNSLIHK